MASALSVVMSPRHSAMRPSSKTVSQIARVRWLPPARRGRAARHPGSQYRVGHGQRGPHVHESPRQRPALVGILRHRKPCEFGTFRSQIGHESPERRPQLVLRRHLARIACALSLHPALPSSFFLRILRHPIRSVIRSPPPPRRQSNAWMTRSKRGFHISPLEQSAAGSPNARPL